MARPTLNITVKSVAAATPESSHPGTSPSIGHGVVTPDARPSDPPKPCTSGTRASARSSGFGYDDSIARSRSVSWVSIDGRRYSGSTRPTSSSSARMRRAICMLSAPHARISVHAMLTKSSQLGVRKITRGSPVSSQTSSPRSWCLPRKRRRRCTWSMASTAVVGSLIAGESALRAMSTRMRKANMGSCSSVRSGPMAIVARRSPSPISAAPLYKTNSGSSVATKSPTWGASSTTPPWRRASATRVVRSTASTMPAFAVCGTVRAGAPSSSRSGPASATTSAVRAGYTERMTSIPSSPTLATTLTGRRRRAA